MPKHLPIHKLTPSAVRLWAASVTQQEGESYDDLVRRSGIHEYETFRKAREQLIELGFFVVREGRECPMFYVQDSEAPRITEPVATMWPGTISHITKAKQ